jgi:hypothetical protein
VIEIYRKNAIVIAFAIACCSGLLGSGARNLVAQETASASTDYQRQLQEYLQAHEKYELETKAYWNLIAEKRRSRMAKWRNQEPILPEDYVLAQPPAYTGRAKPANSSGGQEEQPLKYIPVKADFLRNAAKYFQFAPQEPEIEIQYKRGYARAAFAAGLTREQVVRIYAFEAGGDGTYDAQAGLETGLPGPTAISTALGYNQLLATNSIGLIAKEGDELLARLKKKAERARGRAGVVLDQRSAAFEKIIRFCRSVPYNWSEHEKLAGTPEGIGVHAVNLDVDLGPLLQAQKLLESVLFARKGGVQRILTAAELEMMNLSGDGNGLDMITMPEYLRARVPTANFFGRGGYDRNPIVIENNVVSTLILATNAAMDEASALAGAKDLEQAFLAVESSSK